MPDRTESEVIIETAQQAASSTALLDQAGAYVFSVPSGTELETVDLEYLQPNPRRAKTTRQFIEPASLVAYVTEHATPATHLYGNLDTFRVTAVLDDHTAQAAGWGDHRAVLTARRTEEWQRWKKLDSQYIGRVAFAEHIEDGLREIVDPPGADLLEMAQTFEANTKVAFRSENRLKNGQRQLVWEETIEAKAGQKGQLVVPETLTLALVPFEGMEAVQITARLRFRIREGELKIGYKLDHPEQVERDCFAQILAVVQSGTGITPLIGTD
jgi:uncharacterized protein YfdQ (DUF2303 family)